MTRFQMQALQIIHPYGGIFQQPFLGTDGFISELPAVVYAHKRDLNEREFLQPESDGGGQRQVRLARHHIPFAV